MKRLCFLCLILAALLCGCGPTEAPVPETSAPETTVPETTVPESTVPDTTIPETTVPDTTVPAETEPEHSDLYLYYIPVEDVITWFNEVVLDAEFVDAGDPTRVQKWEIPIGYTLHGNVTPEDVAVLESFAQSLNCIAGFPGIYEAEDPDGANLHFYFTDADEIVEIMGEEFSNSDGAMRFWYDDENTIHNAVICIRDDIDQYLRNSVILEEVYNGLGPVQDTMLRPDSIIYQEYTQPQDLTLEDWVILRLLYHPDMLCGMDAAECEAVIRSLYY